jgi:hypothetical protein
MRKLIDLFTWFEITLNSPSISPVGRIAGTDQPGYAQVNELAARFTTD